MTHECTEDKKNNGGRIIEIKITKEVDAFRDIIERDDGLPIRFFNFKTDVFVNPSHTLNHIKVVRKANGIVKDKEVSLCSKGLVFDENSLYEVIVASELKEKNEIELFNVLCNRRGIHTPNEQLCCKTGFFVTRRKTKEYKSGYFTCGEKRCPCMRFQYDEEKGNEILKKYESVPYWEKQN